MQSTTGVRPKNAEKAEDFPEHYDEFKILEINAESSRSDVPTNSDKNQGNTVDFLEGAAHHLAGGTGFTLAENDPSPLLDIREDEQGLQLSGLNFGIRVRFDRSTGSRMKNQEAKNTRNIKDRYDEASQSSTPLFSTYSRSGRSKGSYSTERDRSGQFYEDKKSLVMRKCSALTIFEQEQEDGWRCPDEEEHNGDRGRQWNHSRRESGKNREPQKGKKGRYTRDLWAYESMESDCTEEESDGDSRRKSYREVEEEENRRQQSGRGNQNRKYGGRSPRRDNRERMRGSDRKSVTSGNGTRMRRMSQIRGLLACEGINSGGIENVCNNETVV
ncbi:hypothetical protein QAD02_003668 [Eretmocerus hayati]|uniref:Uncharacterized protein n=1 Tax=Eretmocerus hayati TaxID=131215 RepID=A0ACC2NQ21_9HYME|nr:hypothetical protein QAD02_003668 [Eretmocerus hayati]